MSTFNNNNYNPAAASSSSSSSSKFIRSNSVKEEHDEEIVSLNVGGQVFVTTTTTLRNDTGSMLYAMFSGKYPTRKDFNGSYFIDRDDGDVDVPENLHTLQQILREAKFFQVNALVRILGEKIKLVKEAAKMKMQGDYAVVYLGGYGNNAAVYTKNTEGGFTSSCVALNKLSEKGYKVEGVASGPNGNYYAILRTNLYNIAQSYDDDSLDSSEDLTS